MKKIIILLTSLLLTSCTNDQTINSKSANDYSSSFSFNTMISYSYDDGTGHLVSGYYSFNSFESLSSFYSVFIIKNEERFLIPNFYLNDIVYYFASGGVPSEVIDNKIFDYDFPSPSFICSNESFQITFKSILDYSQYDFSQQDEYHFYDLNNSFSDLYYGELKIANLEIMDKQHSSSIKNSILNGFISGIFL